MILTENSFNKLLGHFSVDKYSLWSGTKADLGIRRNGSRWDSHAASITIDRVSFSKNRLEETQDDIKGK